MWFLMRMTFGMSLVGVFLIFAKMGFDVWKLNPIRKIEKRIWAGEKRVKQLQKSRWALYHLDASEFRSSFYSYLIEKDGPYSASSGDSIIRRYSALEPDDLRALILAEFDKAIEAENRLIHEERLKHAEVFQTAVKGHLIPRLTRR